MTDVVWSRISGEESLYVHEQLDYFHLFNHIGLIDRSVNNDLLRCLWVGLINIVYFEVKASLMNTVYKSIQELRLVNKPENGNSMDGQVSPKLT